MKKRNVVIGIVISLLLGVSVPLVMDAINNKVNPPSSSEDLPPHIPLDPEFLEKPTDGSKPSDHDIYDNYRIAGGVLSLTDNFKTVQEGNALSEMIIKNNQKVKAQRVVNEDKAYVTYSTSSSFVETAVERFYLEDKVIVRNGKFDDGVATFSDDTDPQTYSYEYILDNIGWLPFSMTSYVINEETIVSSQVVEDENYVMEFVLDNSSSISNTKREIRYNANAVSYPKYKQVKVSITLDDEWRVLQVKTEDIYDITVKMGINITTEVKSTLIEKFYYEDCALSSIPSYSYFNQFIEEEIDDNEEVIEEKRALDYIFDVVFDVLLNGTTFDTNIKMGETSLDGKIDVKIDTTNMSASLKGLFSDFFFKYDGKLYISYLKHNYSFNEEFLSHVLDVLSSGLVETTETLISEDESSNEIEKIIDSLVLTKDGNNTTVSTTLESEESSINVVFNFYEMLQGSVLKSIVITGEDLEVKLAPTKNKIEFEEQTYTDLSSTTWLVDELVEISSYNGINLHFDYPVDDYDLDIDVNIIDENNIRIDFIVSSLEETPKQIELYYIDQVYYLELENYMIQATQEDIDLLIEYIVSFLEDEEENEVPVALEENVENSEEIDVLEIIYNVVGVISITEDNKINIPLVLSYFDEALPDTNILISIEKDNLKVEFEDIPLEMFVLEFDEEIKLPFDKVIYDKDEMTIVEDHITNLVDLFNKDNVQLEFSDISLITEQGHVYVDGKYNKNKEDYSLEMSLKGDFNVMFRVTYLSEKYYLSLGEDSYTINLILSQKQMETFLEYIDEVFGYIFDENDFNISLESFISDIALLIEQIINGEFEMSLGEVIYEGTSLVDSSYLEIDERNIIIEFDETKLQLFKISDNYIFMVENLVYDSYEIDGEIYLKEREYQISVNTSSFIDISEIFDDLGILLPNENENNQA